jgi:DNA-binding LacI/PurR family transcriptional regulator
VLFVVCQLYFPGNSLMKKPTQLDVARLAGVSRTTVSFVVGGKNPNGVLISDETRQRVLDAVDQLGYVVNAGAQALRSGDTKTIGVMLPIYENPFFWEILKGISREANESGYAPLTRSGVMAPSAMARHSPSSIEYRYVTGMVRPNLSTTSPLPSVEAASARPVPSEAKADR